MSYSLGELKKLYERGENLKSIIAKNVKYIIKQKGLKQGAVGKMAGYDCKAFSNMLNGRKIITDTDVLKIANALDLSLIHVSLGVLMIRILCFKFLKKMM